MKRPVRFLLNGESADLNVDPDRKLLWVLRTDAGLTGTKYGCGRGLCGSCTVLVSGKAVRSCRLPVRAVEGGEVTTIEGLAQGDELHPLQKAFAEEGALQCGFCTPGMIMSAEGLLREKPRPNREELLQGMEGNICRCGTHVRILKAIEAVAGAAEEAGR